MQQRERVGNVQKQDRDTTLFTQFVPRWRCSASWMLMALLLAAVTGGLLGVAWSAAHALSVVATIPVGDSPRGVAVNPLTNRIYVANYASRDVSVVDGATDSVIAMVGVDYSPRVVAVNPQTNHIYVGNCNIPTWGACVIDGATDSVIASLGITIYRDMAVNAQTNRIYAHTISGYEDRVTVVDAATYAVLD